MENKVYTDLELRDATQVAYLDFINDTINNLSTNGNNGPYTIRDLIMARVDSERVEQDGINVNDLSLQDLTEYLDISDFDKGVIKGLSESSLNWKIVDIHNTNEENGFYGCVIETSEKDAIVAFRGSEGYKHDYSGLINDWVKADFGLVKNESTEQQLEVERYLDSLSESKVLDQYDFLASTGHSLGGNLATHFGIAASMDDKRSCIFDILGQVVSFDGPGFSNEYLDKYKDGIKNSADMIQHYKWSPVGNVLKDIPGEHIEHLDVKENPGKDNFLGRAKYKFLRHSIGSINFSKSGRAIRGEQDKLSQYIHSLSVAIEYIPLKKAVESLLPNEILAPLNVISTTIKRGIYQKENGKIGFSLTGRKPHEMNLEEGNNLVCGDLMKRIDDERQENAKDGKDDVEAALEADYRFCDIRKIQETTQNLRKQYGENIQYRQAEESVEDREI